jgi:molybdopterin converting factor small subunit
MLRCASTMARITFTSNLQRHLDAPTQHCDGATLGAALEQVFAANPRLRSYILDDQGEVRKHVAVYLNSERIAARHGLDARLAPDDEVFVFQALSGG